MNKLADIPTKAAPQLAPSADLNREAFFNQMIGTLCGTIEDVVGVEDAEAFIGIVGRQIGNSDLARAETLCGASSAQLADYLQQFKAQIGGEFVIEDVAEDSVTFTNCNIYQNTAVCACFETLPRNLIHRPDGLTVTALFVSRYTSIHSSLSRIW